MSWPRLGGISPAGRKGNEQDIMLGWATGKGRERWRIQELYNRGREKEGQRGREWGRERGRERGKERERINYN